MMTIKFKYFKHDDIKKKNKWKSFLVFITFYKKGKNTQALWCNQHMINQQWLKIFSYSSLLKDSRSY